MNHQRQYDLLIESRWQRDHIDGYTEKHHIVPRSLGGSDDPSNLIALTAKEHYIAHLLLAKIHGGPMVHALHMMKMGRNTKFNSVMYEWYRIEHSKLVSKIGKKRVGKSNGSHNTMWVCNVATEHNKKISKDAMVPEGYVRGRNRWKLPRRRPRKFSKVFDKLRYHNQALIMVLKFKEANLNVEAFTRKFFPEKSSDSIRYALKAACSANGLLNRRR
jgi:hypothetical protein